MIGNTLNLVNYHREEDILVLNWYMGGSSCVGSGLDKKISIRAGNNNDD